MLDQVQSTIQQHRMLATGDTIIVAVSGGADSVTMYHLLKTLAASWDLKLHVAHMDHTLRGEESRQDAEFVARLAECDHIPCTVERADIRGYAQQHKLSLQDAARQVRYKFLERLASDTGARRIALAHTADDQAETVLLWLIRGCGPEGLQGIPPIRPPHIIRPLIHQTRKQIEEYIALHRLSFRQDASNFSRKYRRNHIRLDLLPQLEQINPGVRKALGQLADISYSENLFWQDYCGNLLSQMAAERDAEQICLPLPVLRKLPEAVFRRLIRFCLRQLKEGELERISYNHIGKIREIAYRDKGEKRLILPHGIRVEKSYARLRLTVAPPMPDKFGYDYPVNVPGETVIPEFNLVIRADVINRGDITTFPAGMEAVMDLERLRLPLRIRSRRPGDKFWPLGLSKAKKLKDFLIDAKIPREQREKIPVLVCGEDIVWVVGQRISERHKVGPESSRLLRIKVSFNQ